MATLAISILHDTARTYPCVQFSYVKLVVPKVS